MSMTSLLFKSILYSERLKLSQKFIITSCNILSYVQSVACSLETVDLTITYQSSTRCLGTGNRDAETRGQIRKNSFRRRCLQWPQQHLFKCGVCLNICALRKMNVNPDSSVNENVCLKLSSNSHYSDWHMANIEY